MVPIRFAAQIFDYNIEWSGNNRTVYLSDKNSTKRNITVAIDGALVKMDVPPIIVDDRTLVPVRAIAEMSGAKVNWNETERKVQLLLNDREIQLIIDNNVALVDGEKVTLDSAAMIVQDRTMVPVRFIAETFGYEVQWYENISRVNLISPTPEKPEEPEQPEEGSSQPNTPDYSNRARLVTIGNAYTEKGYRITIKFDRVMDGDYTIFELEDPSRVIVDVENAMTDYSKKFEFSNSSVTAARVGNHDKYMRVVIDLESHVDYETYINPAEDAIIFFFDAEGEIPPDEEVSPGEKPDTPDDGTMTVVIDAGHGGKDPGALGKENGVTVIDEKTVNLAVSLEVKRILEEAGVKVIMTRTSNSQTVSLSKRCVISNDAKADLFVSIHSNAMNEGKEDVNGSMVFYGASKDAAGSWLSSKKVAGNILKDMVAQMGTKDLGVRNGDQLAVIRGTNAPAVLIELAFITNVDDRAMLMSSVYQKKAAEGIASGILKSLGM